jgi:hypothetical protein
MAGDKQSAAGWLDLGGALVSLGPRGDRPLCGRSGPRGPTRGVGACARSIRYVQAVGPGPGVGPAALAAHRRGQGQPLPHPPRQDEDRCSRPGVPLRKRASRGCPPVGAGLRFRPALPPFSGRLFREGGSTSLPAMAFVRTKASLRRVPAGGPPGEGSGHTPLAS